MNDYDNRVVHNHVMDATSRFHTMLHNVASCSINTGIIFVRLAALVLNGSARLDDHLLTAWPARRLIADKCRAA